MKILFVLMLVLSSAFAESLYRSAPGEAENPIYSCLELKHVENPYRNPHYVMAECIYDVIRSEIEKSL